MVSNFYHKAGVAIDKPWPMMPGTVHPARLSKKIAKIRVHPSEITAEQILPFIPDAAKIDQEKDPRLGMVAKILAECSTVHMCATASMQLEPWDFMAVYYDAVDHFGHGFMKYHPPRQKHISEADFELYQGVVEAGYRFHDMMLGVLLTLAGEDTTVILVSDHGFHPDHLRPSKIPVEPAGPAVEHRPYGMIAMKGPGIKKDERIYGANLLDITPTLLTLFGLPVGKDMEGKALVQAFETPPKVKTVPSWEEIEGDHGRHPEEMQLNPVEAREAIKQLVAMGYIEDPGEDKEKAARATIRENNYNLAQAYIDASRYRDALPLLEALWKEEPDEIRYATRLANCYRVLNRLKEARETVDLIVETKKRLMLEAGKKLQEIAKKKEKEAQVKKTKDKKETNEEVALSEKEKHEIRRLRSQATINPFEADVMYGNLLFSEGRYERALEHLLRVEKAAPQHAGLHIQLGSLLLKMKNNTEAERFFRKALDIDQENAQAYSGLSQALLSRKENTEAAEAALNAVSLLYHFPQAHFSLGVALHRIGYYERAVEAFQVAIAQYPDYAAAHRRLVTLYTFHLKNPEKAEAHQQEAIACRERQKKKKRMKISEMPEAPRKSALDSDPSTQVAMAAMIESVSVDKKEVITIVSGLPRSGTSMMMQMLTLGGLSSLTDKQREADEDNPKGYLEFEKVKQLRTDKSWLPEAKGKSVKIIAQLLQFLPKKYHYRVIFMERDIHEILASQTKMIERSGKAGAKLTQDQLYRTFNKQVQQIKIHLMARKIPTLYVSHRETIASPLKVAASVKHFMGDALNETEMARAVDPTLYRQQVKAESVDSKKKVKA